MENSRLEKDGTIMGKEKIRNKRVTNLIDNLIFTHRNKNGIETQPHFLFLLIIQNLIPGSRLTLNHSVQFAAKHPTADW